MLSENVLADESNDDLDRQQYHLSQAEKYNIAANAITSLYNNGEFDAHHGS